MDTVVFACRHNAAKSQMAAAFFAELADPAKAVARSAGTRPAESVNPAVVDVMSELGHDLSGAIPRLLTPEVAAGAVAIVTFGCAEECPAVPGVPVEDWVLPESGGRDLASLRGTRDALRGRVADLVERMGWTRT
jgi:arsenate reductase (thioredoxin)